MANGLNNGQAYEKKLDIGAVDQMIALFGNHDENIEVIEKETGVKVITRENEVILCGKKENVEATYSALSTVMDMMNKRHDMDKGQIRYALQLAKDGQADRMEEIMTDTIAFTHRGKQIKCRTAGQRDYIHSIKKNTLVFAVGPAGTGKTYLAMAMAVLALKNKEVGRIILTRPAVEAGEKLGFLPGDLQDKVDPYLRPLYDALYDFMGMDAYQKLMEKGVIEIAPLAYMRGRTLSESFIILDEAQNCTAEQMKMFLTRFGEGSKVVVTGDITQIDLPKDKNSGLIQALEVLKNVKGIGINRLTYRDVVRHELVQSIVKAYDRYDKKHIQNEKRE
jgi:phosphate starvation-inducible protein PhoH and related proteins